MRIRRTVGQVFCFQNPENDTELKVEQSVHFFDRLSGLSFRHRLLGVSTLGLKPWCFHFGLLPRKEVIQPHLPIRLPCYDFTPVIDLTFDSSLFTVKPLASGAPNFRGVTGGVYKARERIHRDMLIRDY